MRIIPAIDIIDGKCVRLTKGDYNTQKTYSDNPLDVARSFEDYGIRYLHLVDLDGARSKHIVNYKVLNQITHNTSLMILAVESRVTKMCELHLKMELHKSQPAV